MLNSLVGKSQLLKAASVLASNSVRCIGYASTTAGLTAQFFRENNETYIEAGALVKANNGVCCIDEINFMTKEHRGSIHEVMEQQKITMAKAGMIAEIPTKVSIVAGMNKKNAGLPVEMGNINIEGSLLSRFDVIFEMEDPRDPVADAEVSWHILNESKCAPASWSLERLKDHIIVAKEVDAKITVRAEKVLQRYYVFCQGQPAIDRSRNTIRMWNAINRMAICHAKLLLRPKIELIDALTVVMLMENTWSMGHLGLKQPDAVRATYPLGPSKQIAIEILEKLELEHLLEEVEDEEPPRKRDSQPSQSKHEITIDNLDSIFEDDNDDIPLPVSQSHTQSDVFTQRAPTQQSQADDIPDDDFDEEQRNFGSKPSTSTQSFDEYGSKARKSSIYKYMSQLSQPKRIKLAPPAEETSQDFAYRNLNALAENLLNQSSSQQASTSKESNGKSNIGSKLKMFQYSESKEATTSREQKEDESSTPPEVDEDGLDSIVNFKLW